MCVSYIIDYAICKCRLCSIYYNFIHQLLSVLMRYVIICVHEPEKVFGKSRNRRGVGSNLARSWCVPTSFGTPKDYSSLHQITAVTQI